MFLYGRRLEARDDALAAPQPRVELPRVHRPDVGHLVRHHLLQGETGQFPGDERHSSRKSECANEFDFSVLLSD